ncbi:hypothetical protein QCA50_013760 [Cerrena zonata]|uniref:Uncharacterized protein n=1 Tax=Cerrena zonata TaxID=2478898 RepID=A0AAW0FUU9_9APHY
MPAGRSTERSLRNSETQRDIDAANTLISPPPEEMLRATRTRTPSRYSATPEPSRPNGPSTEALSRTPTASKRKRLVSSASSSQSTLAGTDHDQHEKSNPFASVENTPNPKSRKQVKRSVVFASSSSRNPSQAPTTPTKSSTRGSKSPSKSPSKRALTRSPGQANPLANYVEGTRVERRRRSATPVIIPYEPPTDEFTPPREVMYTPVAKPQPKHSKSASRRKSSSPKKKLVMQIKQELPDDVDLNAPIPPPSPSDDPLLLRGPPGSGGSRKRTKSKKRDGAVQTQESQSVDRSSPIEEFFPHDNHSVGNSPDVAPGDDFESGPAGPFDFSAGGDDDDWTSDSDKEFDHVGELTGKYKIVTVPTKADPPSSATRQRQSMWGRPISPFPKVRRKSPILEEDEDEEMPESPSVGAQETDSANNILNFYVSSNSFVG